MDSLSQLALGAALGVATLGRRSAAWKAALWGGVAGTLPDLDVFIDHGDALRNMVMHRGFSHSLFWLTLAAPLLAALPALLHRERDRFARWWLAMWLALVTHPLLDAMTVYGTQLLQPFTDYPFGVGSMFIIDPLYTVPLVVGLVVALVRRAGRGVGAARWGLALSTGYLAWSALAQWQVRGLAEEALAARGGAPLPLLVTPSPLNTILWRVVAMHPDGSYEEAFRSLLDGDRPLRFERMEGAQALRAQLSAVPAVRELARFTHGFYKVQARDGRAWVSDLRMGQEPNYTFTFLVARQEGGRWVPVEPRNEGSRGDAERLLRWVGTRLQGQDVPAPRSTRHPSAALYINDRFPEKTLCPRTVPSISRTPRVVLRSANDRVVMRADDRQHVTATAADGSPGRGTPNGPGGQAIP